MKRSTITITDEARKACPSALPSTEADKQVFKNWILQQIREVCPEKVEFLKLPGAKIDFVKRHYEPLGVRVIVYRSDGLHVWVGALSEEFGEDAATPLSSLKTSDTSDPHLEEFAAEVRTYIIWCEGRLEELRRAGRIKGESELTEKGWAEYTTLIASGFIPSRQKVIWTLQGNVRVPATMVETLASLMLDNIE